jgi:hypothetical protein
MLGDKRRNTSARQDFMSDFSSFEAQKQKRTEFVPGHKYFKGRVIAGKRVHHYVVWDGLNNYESAPPPNLLLVEKLAGRVVIAQIRNGKAGRETITALLMSCDSVVLWARDTAVYRAIVQNLTQQSDGWLL